MVAKLSYYLLTYSENPSGRIDNSYSLTVGASRPWTEKLTVGLTMNYTINNSNVNASQYKKFNSMINLTANDAF